MGTGLKKYQNRKVCFEECIYPEAISFIMANAEMEKNIHLHVKMFFAFVMENVLSFIHSLAKLSLKNCR